jgi:hypothetical protein
VEDVVADMLNSAQKVRPNNSQSDTQFSRCRRPNFSQS